MTRNRNQSCPSQGWGRVVLSRRLRRQAPKKKTTASNNDGGSNNNRSTSPLPPGAARERRPHGGSPLGTDNVRNGVGAEPARRNVSPAMGGQAAAAAAAAAPLAAATGGGGVRAAEASLCQFCYRQLLTVDNAAVVRLLRPDDRQQAVLAFLVGRGQKSLISVQKVRGLGYIRRMLPAPPDTVMMTPNGEFQPKRFVTLHVDPDEALTSRGELFVAVYEGRLQELGYPSDVEFVLALDRPPPGSSGSNSSSSVSNAGQDMGNQLMTCSHGDAPSRTNIPEKRVNNLPTSNGLYGSQSGDGTVGSGTASGVHGHPAVAGLQATPQQEIRNISPAATTAGYSGNLGQASLQTPRTSGAFLTPDHDQSPEGSQGYMSDVHMPGMPLSPISPNSSMEWYPDFCGGMMMYDSNASTYQMDPVMGTIPVSTSTLQSVEDLD